MARPLQAKCTGRHMRHAKRNSLDDPRLVARAHTGGTWAYFRRTENHLFEHKEQPRSGERRD